MSASAMDGELLCPCGKNFTSDTNFTEHINQCKHVCVKPAIDNSARKCLLYLGPSDIESKGAREVATTSKPFETVFLQSIGDEEVSEAIDISLNPLDDSLSTGATCPQQVTNTPDWSLGSSHELPAKQIQVKGKILKPVQHQLTASASNEQQFVLSEPLQVTASVTEDRSCTIVKPLQQVRASAAKGKKCTIIQPLHQVTASAAKDQSCQVAAIAAKGKRCTIMKPPQATTNIGKQMKGQNRVIVNKNTANEKHLVMLETEKVNDESQDIKGKKIPIIKCEKCVQLFLANQNFVAHFLQIHKGCDLLPISSLLKNELNVSHFCLQCRVYFNTESAFRLHIYAHEMFDKEFTKFVCLYCNKKFDDVYKLSEHSDTKHFPCKTCLTPFENRKQYDKHVNQHNLGLIVSYECTYCKFRFQKESQLDSHTKIMHKLQLKSFKEVPVAKIATTITANPGKVSIVLCPYCNAFLSMSAIAVHFESKHNIFICKSCEQPFVRTLIKNGKTALCLKCVENELNIKHSSNYPKAVKTFKCTTCPLVFTDQVACDTHVDTHARTDINDDKAAPHPSSFHYPCLKCGIKFNNISKLDEHMTRVHLTCKVCNIEISNAILYLAHENEHKAGKIIFHVCSCGIAFKSYAKYEEHNTSSHINLDARANKYPIKFVSKELAFANVANKLLSSTTQHYNKFVCVYCHIFFKNKKAIDCHYIFNHNVYRCNTCNVLYISAKKYPIPKKTKAIFNTVNHCGKCKITDQPIPGESSSSSNQTDSQEINIVSVVECPEITTPLESTIGAIDPLPSTSPIESIDTSKPIDPKVSVDPSVSIKPIDSTEFIDPIESVALMESVDIKTPIDRLEVQQTSSNDKQFEAEEFEIPCGMIKQEEIEIDDTEIPCKKIKLELKDEKTTDGDFDMNVIKEDIDIEDNETDMYERDVNIINEDFETNVNEGETNADETTTSITNRTVIASAEDFQSPTTTTLETELGFQIWNIQLIPVEVTNTSKPQLHNIGDDSTVVPVDEPPVHNSEVDPATKTPPKKKKKSKAIPKICDKCNLSFRRMEQYNLHLKRRDAAELPNQFLPCLICRVVYNDTKYLEYHMKKVHYACKLCLMRYRRENELTKHEEGHVSGKIKLVKCICEKIFSSFCHFNLHQCSKGKKSLEIARTEINIAKKCRDDDGIYCPYCNELFLDVTLLKKHRMLAHDVYPCKFCKNNFVGNPKCEINERCDDCIKSNIISLNWL